MIRIIALPLVALPVLALTLSMPSGALAQDGLDSLLDNAPGLGPPPDRRDNDAGDPGFEDDEPRLEDLLDRLERGGSGRREGPSGNRNRRGGDAPDPDGFDMDDDDRPPEYRPDEPDEPEDPTFKRAKPDLGHKVIAGLWAGTVEELGHEPYTIRLTLKEDGTGNATYSKLECTSEIVPIAGRLLEYRENVTRGQEECANGFVQLRLRRGLLLWSWKDDNGEFRAAATLRRQLADETTETAVPAPKTVVDDKSGKVTGGTIPTRPRDVRQQAAD